MRVKHRHDDSSQHLTGSIKPGRTRANERLKLVLLGVLLLGSLFRANAVSAWVVNSYLLYQTGLPDPYTAAEIGWLKREGLGPLARR